MTGRLFLIPACLGEDNRALLSNQALEAIKQLNQFVVENARSARRFLRAMGYTRNFDTEVVIKELNKHASNSSKELLDALFNGKDVGLISEAGNPCIADPGYELVAFAHAHHIQVVPLIGPSSILLALISSGFSGNQFTFHGYLPIESVDRKRKIKQLEEAKVKGGAQLFMETPFRNDQLLKELLAQLQENTRLSIACDITLSTEYIQMKTVKEWRKDTPSLHKRYCIFVIG
ncbi:MAG: SAM-dependent methyltransferase [Chitinophagales bacterium]